MFTGPKIINENLVLYLDAANISSYPGTGDIIYDLSNSNNGNLINTPQYTNNYFTFNGVDQYINVPNSSSLQVDNFTLEAWVYPLNNSENGHIIRKEGSYILSHYWGSSNKLGVWVQRTGGWESTHANITVPLNTWCHVVGTYNNSNMIIYYNGSQVANQSKTGSIRVTNNSVEINGTISNSTYQNYSLSQVKIYNRALSSLEVAQNFNSTRKRFGL